MYFNQDKRKSLHENRIQLRIEFNRIRRGFVRDTIMSAISSFRGTNMDKRQKSHHA